MVPQVFKRPWEQLRSLTSSDDTLLTTFEYDNATYEANKFDIPDDWNSIAIAFYGTDAADEDAVVKLFGRMKSNGPIMELYAGELTLGTRVVTKDPISLAAITAYWVDTITSTGEEWITDATIRNESADNAIAFLVINLFGLKDVYLEIDLDGGDGSAMASLGAIICGSWTYRDE